MALVALRVLRSAEGHFEFGGGRRVARRVYGAVFDGVAALTEFAVGEAVDDRGVLGEEPGGGRVGRPAEIVEPAVAVHAELGHDDARVVVGAGQAHGERSVEDVFGRASGTNLSGLGELVFHRRTFGVDRPGTALG